MNIFKNKYFLLGNLAFLLVIIPVTLFFIKNQISTRGSAAPSTTLSFTPSHIELNECDNTKTAKLVVNPGQNLVSRVKLALKWDTSKFDIDIVPSSDKFQILGGPDDTEDGMIVTIGIGGSGNDVGDAISTTTDLATITIKEPHSTNGSVINLEIATGTKVFSLSDLDEGAAENVLSSASPLLLTINAAANGVTCGSESPPDTGDQPTATPTPVPGAPTATPSASATATPTPPAVAATATPTTSTNQPPLCQTLTSSTTTGTAPLSVTLTATGRDPNGTVSKVTFNFGDGTQQDVTTGMGTASVSAQLAHTYTSGGNFTATSVLTDNSGSLSSACTLQIAVTGAQVTVAPTVTPTIASGGIGGTDTPTPSPTIAASGSIGTTVSVIAGVFIIIIAGIFLLAL